MTFYALILFLHIVAAIGVFVALALESFSIVSFRKASGAAEVRVAIAALWRLRRARAPHGRLPCRKSRRSRTKLDGPFARCACRDRRPWRRALGPSASHDPRDTTRGHWFRPGRHPRAAARSLACRVVANSIGAGLRDCIPDGLKAASGRKPRTLGVRHRRGTCYRRPGVSPSRQFTEGGMIAIAPVQRVLIVLEDWEKRCRA
jgi:hypothetical protein